MKWTSSYRAQVRRKGAAPLSATLTKLSDARKWVQVTEAAIIEGRQFKMAEAKRHTLADLLDRYLADVLATSGHPRYLTRSASYGGALPCCALIRFHHSCP